ncbi:unnamed protein product, partial [Mesorhabditis belari]|uniref:Uncharacterized protein n=1 Tax=Mesorhabditis belari TaxID=2138241 RepID=A0AAF3EMW5_9BILA
MFHESRQELQQHKRRHSLDRISSGPSTSRSPDSTIVDVEIGTAHKQRNLNQTPSPEMPRDNFQYQPTSDNTRRHFDAQAPSTNHVPNPASIAPIVQQLADQMTGAFGEISDAFEHLSNLKITVTEESQRFGRAPIEHRIAQIKSYTNDYLRELLEGEILGNQRLNEKVQLVTKRNFELERRLEFVETNIERVQKEAIDKAEQVIRTLIARFSAQEASLITARDTEANSARELRNTNQIMQVTLTTLEETKDRNMAEIAQLQRDYAQKVENLNQVSMQNEELDKQLENTRRSENDLQRRFNELEESMRRLQDESRTLTRDFNQCKQDNTRLEQQATKDKEKHRQELEIHRDDLQKSWEQFRFRLDNEHRQKLSEYERESKNLQRVLDNTRRDLSYAQAKVRELELSREDFEHAIRDELQRTMMAKYRDMVFEIAPERPIPPQTVSLPTRYFSNSTSRPDPSVSNKENGAKCDSPGNKHELLKQIITKAVNKRNDRRSGRGE